VLVTSVWAAIGIIGPFLVPKSTNKGVYQTMIVSTAVCLWLHWFLTWLSQLNPLFGPKLSSGQIYIMQWQWK